MGCCGSTHQYPGSHTTGTASFKHEPCVLRYADSSPPRHQTCSWKPAEPKKDQKRPCCVVSYKTEDVAFLKQAMQKISELGFEAWNGSLVEGGAGAGDWSVQWVDKVEETNTKLVVFLLSSSFVESPACIDEFKWVFERKDVAKCGLRTGLLGLRTPRPRQRAARSNRRAPAVV